MFFHMTVAHPVPRTSWIVSQILDIFYIQHPVAAA